MNTVDDFFLDPAASVELWETELVVRDFLAVLNDGGIGELTAFFAEDVLYRPAPHQVVRGRTAVIAMLQDIRETFEVWEISLINVAVTGEVVLCEQAMKLKLRGCEERWVMSFSSFRVEQLRITAWHQLHG